MNRAPDKKNAKEIFSAAIEYYMPDQWEGYLVDACGDDEALRQRVRELLEAHRQGDSFLDGAGKITEGQPVTERPGSQIGPYKLLQEIGEGGFGVVYMAEQQEPVRRKVALKIIKPGMDTKQVIARFEAERQALAMMDHPNIAKVLGAGATESGRPFFVMELVKGVPVTEFCDSNKLSTQQRLDLFVTVCHAVQHAHQKGVIHRDIKPSNVMVTLHDNKPMPVIIDFGVSKAISHQLTEKTLFTAYGQMVGTPAYMSPEQAQMSRMDIDTRSDIYSLGVLLYELLTGGTPLDAQQLRGTAYAEMQRMIREEEAPKPSTRVSTLGKALSKIAQDRGTDPKRLGQFLRGDLDWIVMKALEKERSRRYETANGLANDIERFLNDEAVEACPPSLTYQVRKFVGRNRGLVTTASMVMAAVLLGIVGTTIGMLRARHDAGVARTALTEADRLRVEKVREAELAMRAKREADRLRDEAKSQSAEHLMMRASAERDRGDVTLAALLGAEALRQDSGNPERELNHRLRLAADLRQCPRPTEVLFHDSRVLDARFSGDGQWIATGCEDGTVRVFDAQTGEIERVLEHEGPVSQLTFLLNDTRLLTNETVADAESVDEAIRVHLWDWRSGQSIAVNSSRDSTWRPGRYRAHTFPIAAGSHEFRVLSARDGQPIGPRLASERFINTCHYFGDAGLVVGLAPPQEPVANERSPVDSFREYALSQVGLPSPTKLEVWSADSGERVTLFEVEPSRERFSNGLTSADGSRFAMGYRGHIHIFDTRSGELLQRVELVTVATRPNAFGTSFRSAVAGTPREFSPDGGTLFCSQGSEIVLIDVESGTVRSRIRPVIQPAIRSLGQPAIGQRARMELTKFSPDSSLILAVNGQGHPQLWDATSGQVASGPLENDSAVADCEFSAGGRYVKVESTSGAVRIWDLETQQPAAPLMRHSGTIQKSIFSRDGSQVLVAAGDKVYLWPVGWPEFRQVAISTAAAGIPDEAVNRGLFARASQAHISPDGTRLITTFRDAQVWDTTTGRRLLEPFRLSNDPSPWSVNFDANGRFVLFDRVGFGRRSPGRDAGSNRGATTFLWDTKTGRHFDLHMEGQLGNTGVSDDGSVVWATARRMSGMRDDFRAAVESGFAAPNIQLQRFTHFWDSETGQPLGEPIAEVAEITKVGEVRRAFIGTASLVSRDAAWMVTRDADAFHIVDTRTGKQIKDSIPHEEEGVRQAMLSHDNRSLISVCKGDDRLSVREWDLEHDRGCLHHREIKLSTPFPNPTVQISPTNKQFVVHSVAVLRRGLAMPSRSRDSEASTVVLVGELATDQTLQLHHEFAVQHVAFSPDGSAVLTSSLDRVIRVWDTATGELLRALGDAGESAMFTAARFSHDGRRVVAVKGNHGLCIWDVATGQSLAPPLRTQSEGASVRFGRGGRNGQFVSNKVSRSADRFVVRRDGQFTIYDLSADTRSVEDLTQLARVLSGRRVNQLGNVETLRPGDWKQEWAACGDRLYERMEEPPRGEDWHRLHVESSDPAVVLWHLGQLIAADPKDGERYKKRARTLIRLDRHEEAVADLDAARALGVTVDDPRGRSLLILRRWAEAAVDLESAALDRSMSTINPIDFYGAAVAHLLAGDRGGYERVSELFLKKALKFPESQAPIHAIRVALLAPRDEAYCEDLQQQWEDTVSSTRSGQSSRVLIDQLFAFRCGDYPAVVAGRDETADGQPNESANQLFLLAMAHHQLGDEEIAKELLAEATALTNEVPNTIQLYDGTRQLDNGTRDLVILPLQTAMVLQREAIDLIGEDELPNE